MNKYTFHWNVAPALEAEFALQVSPFDIVARENTLSLEASDDDANEQRLRDQADEVAHNLARSLSFECGERFEVASAGCHVVRPGQQGITGYIHATLKPVAISASGAAEWEARDAAGNVIDSSALRDERERQAMQQRIALQARRAAIDTNLSDMLDHWARYAADPEGRLAPLYDVLQVAERLYARREDPRKQRHKQIASKLNIGAADLAVLGDITNDIKLLNGRHPGASSGPHPRATEDQVATCERVARAIIESYAAKIVV
jgi:hypothetical protein